MSQARLAAGLPTLRPDGSPYVRGPYKPRALKSASAAGGAKQGRQKPGMQPRQPDQKVSTPACSRALKCKHAGRMTLKARSGYASSWLRPYQVQH